MVAVIPPINGTWEAWRIAAFTFGLMLALVGAVGFASEVPVWWRTRKLVPLLPRGRELASRYLDDLSRWPADYYDEYRQWADEVSGDMRGAAAQRFRELGYVDNPETPSDASHIGKFRGHMAQQVAFLEATIIKNGGKPGDRRAMP